MSTPDFIRDEAISEDVRANAGRLGRDSFVNYNLLHLTESDLLTRFFKQHPSLSTLHPLCDAIIATNSADKREILRNKYRIDVILLKHQVWTSEDSHQDHVALDVLRSYIHQILDGTYNGYRGKMVTEEVRRYESADRTERQRGWGLR